MKQRNGQKKPINEKSDEKRTKKEMMKREKAVIRV